MNRQQRRRIADTRILVPTVAAEPTLEGRFQMFAAAMQTWLALGAKHGFDQKEIAEELGGDLARRIVERFDAAPIRDMHQTLIYYMSSDPVHRAASEGWQMMHPAELLALQAKHPGIGPLRTPNEEETGGYLLILRQAAYLVLVNTEDDDGERTRPVLALVRLMNGLADLYRDDRLVGVLEEPQQPHDRRKIMIEVFASFFARPAETVRRRGRARGRGSVRGDVARRRRRLAHVLRAGGAALPECGTMTGAMLIHPAARLPAASDATGQGWLPPLWLWPESGYRSSWEWQYEPEYLVATGRAASIGEASLMIVQVVEARLAENPDIWRQFFP